MVNRSSVREEIMKPGNKKKPKLGTGKRFKDLDYKLKKKGAKDPKALAAYIGRRKYGPEKFAKLSKKGKKKRRS